MPFVSRIYDAFLYNTLLCCGNYVTRASSLVHCDILLSQAY